MTPRETEYSSRRVSAREADSEMRRDSSDEEVLHDPPHERLGVSGQSTLQDTRPPMPSVRSPHMHTDTHHPECRLRDVASHPPCPGHQRSSYGTSAPDELQYSNG